MSSELSNELKFKNQEKIIVVAYNNHAQGNASISLRGDNIRKILLNVIPELVKPYLLLRNRKENMTSQQD